MEADKGAKRGKATLDTILLAVERGFAAVASDIGDVKDEIADMRKMVVTKDYLREELAPIHAELKSIRRDLDDLREKVENVIGFRREIDHALERVAAIEKHLGIEKKIAA